MVEILLPVYNGAKYLKEQIDSILLQTFDDWHLTFRDDGSSDYSVSIIEYYCQLYPEKISCLTECSVNLGVTKSFEYLLNHSKSKYLMLSDQDDIWLPDKIMISLNELKKLEQQGGDLPCLVCTDVKCINSKGVIINNSFFKSQKFYIDVIGNESKMLALNIVQGSTVMINRRALDYILPIPQDLFHDKWIGVIISHFGLVSYISTPTMLYRQHMQNVVGANSIGFQYFFSKIINLKKHIVLCIHLYRALPFKPNILKWIFYKIYYTWKRLF